MRTSPRRPENHLVIDPSGGRGVAVDLHVFRGLDVDIVDDHRPVDDHCPLGGSEEPKFSICVADPTVSSVRIVSVSVLSGPSGSRPNSHRA